MAWQVLLFGIMRSNAAYRKLETWQVAMDFVERCYKLTRNFPREELHGLTSQLRRAAVSIPSNVAKATAVASRCI